MLNPRTLLLLFVLLVSVTWSSFSGSWQKPITHKAGIHSPTNSVHTYTAKKLKEKAAAAAVFAAQKGYNNIVCFLIDMSVPSGQNRFFIYHLQKDSVLQSGLVTHGRCNQNWLEGRKYGNTVGCGCTSLGKYKIGYAYNGRFGLAYKLYGLDKTNDKAFERFVVLHAHECVPATEVNEEICQSDGCPTVSPGFLQTLRPVITASKKPVLLWIYE